MRTITALVALVLTASPALAQSRVYTNADLTLKPVTWTRTVTAEELRGLEARQFHVPAPTPDPLVTVVPYDPDWPFRTSTLDAINTPLFEPWSMTAYVGRRYGGHSSGGRGASERPGPSHARAAAARAPDRSAPRRSRQR